MEENFKKKRFVLLFVLALNWLVAAAKVAVGLFFGIVSMVADGIHSFSDGASNLVGLVGLSAASKPVDPEHPYGHKKIENFTSLGISMLLLLVCYEIFESAISRITRPTVPDASPITFAVMFITLAVNGWVVFYEYRKGKELGSDILIADSMHTRADIFVSLSVLVSLVGIRLGWPLIDPAVSFMIIGFILSSAINISRHVFDVLVDRSVIDRGLVEKVVLENSTVKKCHKIRTRGRLDDIHVDLHIKVNSKMEVAEAHALSHLLQENIKRSIPGVTDVIIHVEPYKQ
ncbi:hypothetical protein A2276_03910 [candidate division WOR-1 bacterium RIFOXYA12_FULL_43_27]|uniref:Uncharacterized protein n=1 Tax=candidate division WOR-1 bacterium RIFOXYC2_FULL_46_14 TaxID=1802587 RepID=A0A1F4U780_UNCSA|nr:MAG: hypothetical protein A2276_03910 [candidate division WOR-1 bacterium RIFOXYA12_FULL_43_27]OGC19161.1 MAG: hypothetical protein A2292_00425 [candidate division WOR-1 bacterium RIFOXYB2_FULL_46_45]OGC30150.1 MAG: hypothetical protein A2232_00425 [candidate division WOR-1 bacterium RIFOXYA2_FULL_46_56]OGC40752.1 MAG: hypothetical protein A2438_00430 [candidate division WOR-1 bacterium RIFOXYC2_FULL_46_14]